MSYEIRPITEDEYTSLSRVLEVAFGGGSGEEEVEGERAIFEYDRSVGVFDGDQVVGSAGAYTFDLTLPGNTTTQVAGVTWVGVLSTHRRKGILRSMMAHQLADVRERGEALAILTASEASIYGRFGYGLANFNYSAEIALPAPFLTDVPLGRLAILSPEEAAKVFPGVYDRWRVQHPGAITRRPEWWDLYFKDPQKWRNGASSRFYVVHEDAPGRPDGYAAYRVKGAWQDSGLPKSELRFDEVVSLTPESHAALWRYCLDVDLVRSAKIRNVPVDEPIRWRFENARHFHVSGAHDHLWARLLDVPAALSARRYDAEGKLVLEVHDEFLPDAGGRFEVTGGPEGASAKRAAKAKADLSLGSADLGAAYLGGVSFTTLAQAGRVVEERKGALARADAMFRSTPAPFCHTGF